MERRLGTPVVNQSTRHDCEFNSAKESSRAFGNAMIRFQIKGPYRSYEREGIRQSF